mmetsp:Transcript_29769/g.53849  ORF Transcript_29769/g.53849 Transcript_29769/m.53849 type:complete len:260 (+) Transcript_29769:1143-1922(+)
MHIAIGIHCRLFHKTLLTFRLSRLLLWFFFHVLRKRIHGTMNLGKGFLLFFLVLLNCLFFLLFTLLLVACFIATFALLFRLLKVFVILTIDISHEIIHITHRGSLFIDGIFLFFSSTTSVSSTTIVVHVHGLWFSRCFWFLGWRFLSSYRLFRILCIVCKKVGCRCCLACWFRRHASWCRHGGGGSRHDSSRQSFLLTGIGRHSGISKVWIYNHLLMQGGFQCQGCGSCLRRIFILEGIAKLSHVLFMSRVYCFRAYQG